MGKIFLRIFFGLDKELIFEPKSAMSKFVAGTILAIGLFSLTFMEIVYGILVFCIVVLALICYKNYARTRFPIIRLDETGISFSYTENCHEKVVIPWREIMEIRDILTLGFGLGILLECEERCVLRDPNANVIDKPYYSPNKYIVYTSLYVATQEEMLHAFKCFRRQYS